MAQTQPGQPLADGVSTFPDSLDTSVPARSLKKTQLSRAQNVSLRNGFATHRNTFKKVRVDFCGDSTLEGKLKNVRWQKGVYYEADTGPEFLVAVIGGRMFRFDIGPQQAPIGTLTACVSEITSRFQTQLVWDFTVPAVGSTVTVTVVSTDGFTIGETIEVGIEGFAPANSQAGFWYPGYPMNGPTPLSVGHYIIISILPNGQMVIQNVDDMAGNVVPAGGAVAGYDPNPPNRRAWLCQAEKWVVWTDGQSPTVFYDGVTSRRSIGMQFSVDPEAPKTQAVVAFSAPAIGVTVKVSVQDTIGFNVGAEVTVGAYNYAVNEIDATASPQTLTLVNLNDTSLALYPIGTEILWPLIKDTSELPPGRMMAYGKGRLVMAGTDGKTFLFSNLVGDSSGTKAENYRDSVLKIRDSNRLTGGRFRVPGVSGDVSALIFMPMLDASLGQGPLQVHSTRRVFNCNLPTNSETWQELRTAILTETDMLYGSLSQEGVIAVNGDIQYRSRRGVDSMVMRRRDFYQWGSAPISTEVKFYLDNDQEDLLEYASQIVFDNRRLTTCSPVTSPYGVYHRGLVSMDLVPLGRAQDKTAPGWEGLWEDATGQGLRIFQLMTGVFRGAERAFAFALGDANEIELYEIIREGVANFDNNGERIKWVMEFSSLFDDDDPTKRILKRLINGEIAVEQVSGAVTFDVFYRHDEYQAWTRWHTWSVCANTCPPTSPCLPSENYRPQHRSRMGLGEPGLTICDSVNNKPARDGYYFHVRLEITGHCYLAGLPLAAITIPEQKYAPLVCAAEPCYISTADCDQIRPPFA